MHKATNYFTEVRSELKKVEWPKREDAVKLTVTVVVMTIIVGLFVGALDFTFARLLEYFLSI